MRGHVRRRGKQGSFEYIVDIGLAATQRCTVCNKRVLDRAPPLGELPEVRQHLRETEERRRETKAGFGTQKECQAAMNKLLVSVEQHNYTAPSKATVRQYLTKEWLPAVKATIRPSTYNSCRRSSNRVALRTTKYVVPQQARTVQLRRPSPPSLCSSMRSLSR